MAEYTAHIDVIDLPLVPDDVLLCRTGLSEVSESSGRARPASTASFPRVQCTSWQMPSSGSMATWGCGWAAALPVALGSAAP
jgi:hypothetical protein